MITTAAINEAVKSVWCCEYGAHSAELDKWRASCSPQTTRADYKQGPPIPEALVRGS